MTASRSLEESAQQAARRIGARRRGVIVGARRGVETVTAAAGDSGSGTPLDARALVEIGSITKVFTALLLADGVVRGDWELRTPVRALLPTAAEVPSRNGVEVTLQHLATHTSGLVRSPFRMGLRANLSFLQFGTDPYADFTADDLLIALGSTRLRRKPGAGGVKYSNFGYGVLGHALAHAVGKDYGEVIAERICEPLGLEDTAVPGMLTAEQQSRAAQGYRGGGRIAEAWPLAGLPGAGALRSTARDVLVFLHAQLDPASSPLEQAIRLTHRTPPGGPSGMGLGWHRAGQKVMWHNGGTGGFRTIAAFRQDAGTAVTVLVNQSAGADVAAMRLLKQVS